jgi:hypothetical protein
MHREWIASRRKAGWIVAAVIAGSASIGADAHAATTDCRPARAPFSAHLSAATCTPASARLARAVSFPASTRLRLTVPVRSAHPGGATLVRLAENRVRVSLTRGGRVTVVRSGRAILATRFAARRWTSVRLDLDTAGGTIAVRAQGAARRAHVRGLVHETRAVIGGPANAAVLLGGATVRYAAAKTAAPGAAAPAVAPAPAAPALAPIPIGTVPPRPFAPTSVWNAPLASTAPLDRDSPTYVSELQRLLTITNPWINTTPYSSPVYTVPAGQPTVRVQLDVGYTPLQQTWQAVPLPAGAKPAEGSDKHLVVWQPSTDKMWEFWHMGQNADGSWHARWGGTMDRVSANPGYFNGTQSSWGATATSLPLLGGMIRIDEVRAGRIDHALALALPQNRKGVVRWPAQRTDGSSTSPAAIQEGMRFRLDPTLDIAALNLPRMTRLMAEAAQRYGIVVRDTSGSVSFYAEDSTPLGRNVWREAGGLFGGQSPNIMLARFPWSRLQVLG